MGKRLAAAMLRHAIAYANHGLPVVFMRVDKCGVRKPILKLGCYDATCNPDRLNNFYERYAVWGEPPGVALLLGPQSKLWCLDVDAKHGRDGLDQLAEYESSYGRIKTCRQRTPSGGLHLLFDRPAELDGVKNRDCLLGSGTTLRFGLEAKLHGSLAIQEPSDFGKGRYRYESGLHPLEFDPKPAPDWLIDLVLDPPAMAVRERQRKRRYRELSRSRPLRRYNGTNLDLQLACNLIASLRPGEQYSELNRICFSYGLKFGSTNGAESQLLDAALRMVNQSGEAPWYEHQLDKIVRIALQDGSRQRRSKDDKR